MKHLRILEEAIQKMKVVEFDYDGLHRIVHPHILYRNEGKVFLDAYQVAGESKEGGLPDWRSFFIEKIEDCFLQDKMFYVEHTYHPDNGKYQQEILAKL